MSVADEWKQLQLPDSLQPVDRHISIKEPAHSFRRSLKATGTAFKGHFKVRPSGKLKIKRPIVRWLSLRPLVRREMGSITVTPSVLPKVDRMIFWPSLF